MNSKLKNEFPLILFCLCFVALLVFVLKNSPVLHIEETKEEPPQSYIATGLTKPFQAKDIWWLEKETFRDPEKFLNYMNGRRLGFHHIFKEFCRKNKLKPYNEFFGVYMEISETGVFENVMPAYTNNKNAALAKKTANYIEDYFRYTPAKGRDKIILLVRFDAKQPLILERDIQSK